MSDDFEFDDDLRSDEPPPASLTQDLFLQWRSPRRGNANPEIDEQGKLPIYLGMAYFISDDDFLEASKVGFDYLEQKMQDDPDYWRKIKSAE